MLGEIGKSHRGLYRELEPVRLTLVKPTTHHANDPLARGAGVGIRRKIDGTFFTSCGSPEHPTENPTEDPTENHRARPDRLATDFTERAAEPSEPQPGLVRSDGAAATDQRRYPG